MVVILMMASYIESTILITGYRVSDCCKMICNTGGPRCVVGGGGVGSLKNYLNAHLLRLSPLTSNISQQRSNNNGNGNGNGNSSSKI